jgi:hypothetical protein
MTDFTLVSPKNTSFRTQYDIFSLTKKRQIQSKSTHPDAGCPDRLGPSRKLEENSTKLTCLEITGYRIKYNRVLRLAELQIRRGQNIYLL